MLLTISNRRASKNWLEIPFHENSCIGILLLKKLGIKQGDHIISEEIKHFKEVKSYFIPLKNVLIIPETISLLNASLKKISINARFQCFTSESQLVIRVSNRIIFSKEHIFDANLCSASNNRACDKT